MKLNKSYRGDRNHIDKQAKKAHKQFRQNRKAARGSVWLSVKEA